MPTRTQAQAPVPTREELPNLTLNELRQLYYRLHPGPHIPIRSKAAALSALHDLVQPAPRAAADVKARMADVVIRIMADGNPYRPGSKAADHFAKMGGGITIREYLAKFSPEEQRTARQWLYNATKSNYVKTLGGEA